MKTEKAIDIAISKLNNRDKFSQNLEKALQKIAQKEGFIEHKIYKRKITTNGGNYLGDLYEIDIKGKTNEGEKEVNLFVKKILDDADENIKEDVSVTTLYDTEVFSYTELSAVLKELQDQANIPDNLRFKMAKGYEESSSEAIILENLSKKGYKTGHRMDLVTYEMAKLSIEQLAKFHSLSFVLERLRPNYFEEKIKSIKYPVGWLNTIDRFIDNTISNIEDCHIQCKMREFTPHVVKNFIDYFVAEKAPIRSLVHGDYRSNNILVKEIDGKLTDIIPVDYQIINYGCPVNDFLYFIYMGTNLEFRKKHFENLKDIYYETMRRFLQYFEMEVEEVLPRQLLEDTIQSRRDFGVMIVLIFSGFLYVHDDNILDIGSQKLEDWKPTFVPYFQERIKEFFDEYFGSDYD